MIVRRSSCSNSRVAGRSGRPARSSRPLSSPVLSTRIVNGGLSDQDTDDLTRGRPTPLIGDREVPSRVRIVRVDLERATVVRLPLVDATLHHEHVPEVVVRRGEAVVEPERALVLLGRLGGTVLRREHVAEVVEGLGIARTDAGRLAELDGRLV